MRYWLFKCEPTTFSIHDLSQLPQHTTHWEGVRNYQARNMLRDQIKIGDQGLFYHSNCQQPAIVGKISIVSQSYPDFTSWDPHSSYFDPRSSPATPRWWMVDVKLLSIFKHPLSLASIKAHPVLKQMIISQQGNRLSITPVTTQEWSTILSLVCDHHHNDHGQCEQTRQSHSDSTTGHEGEGQGKRAETTE